jgi:hypothetical protein
MMERDDDDRPACPHQSIVTVSVGLVNVPPDGENDTVGGGQLEAQMLLIVTSPGGAFCPDLVFCAWSARGTATARQVTSKS